MASIDKIIADFNIGIKGEAELKKAINEIKKFEKEANNAEKGTMEWIEAQEKLQKANRKLGDELAKSGKQIDDFNKKLDNNSQGFKKFEGNIASLAKNAVRNLGLIFAADKLIQYGKELLKIEKQYNTLFKTIQRFSGLEGKALTQAGTRISALAKTYGKSTDELTLAINNFAKQTNTEFTAALALVEKGFIQGADAGGDFLSNLQEYPVQFKNAKLSAQDFVRFAVQEVRGGVFDDKLLDSVKELGLSLRELDKAQQDALKPLGEEFSQRIIKDLQEGSRNVTEVFTEIIIRAKEAGLNTQQLQKLVADLGKGALEDLGGLETAYENITAAVQINLDETDALGERQKELLSISKELADEEARLAQNLEGLSGSFGDFFTKLQTQGLSVLNDVIEGFQLLTNAVNFRLGNALRQGIDDNVTQVTALKVKKDVDGLTQVIKENGEELEKWRERLAGAQDAQQVQTATTNIKIYEDAVRRANEALKELSEPTGGGNGGTGGNNGGAPGLSVEEIKRRAKALEAYNELIEKAQFAYRKAEADLLDSDTLRFNLEADKLLKDLKEEIEEIEKTGRAAGITQIEIEADVKIKEQEFKARLKKLTRDYLDDITPDSKGLANIDPVDDLTGTGELIEGDRFSEYSEANRNLRKRIENEEQESLERRRDVYADFYSSLRNAVLDFTNFQISQLDREINYRQDRIEYLSDIQSASAERALEQEKSRQDEAIRRQQQFVAAQRAIATVQTGINMTAGIARVFAETGIAAPAAVPIALGVITSLLASVPSLVNSAMPAFKDGVIDFKGVGSGTSDDNTVRISNHESIITAKGTRLAPEALRLINEGKLSDKSIFANLSPIALSGRSAGVEKEVKRSNDMMAEALRRMTTPEIHKLFLDEKGYRKRVSKMSSREAKIHAKR